MLEDKSYFTNPLFARYATDVTFQQVLRPSGSMQECRAYFSR